MVLILPRSLPAPQHSPPPHSMLAPGGPAAAGQAATLVSGGPGGRAAPDGALTVPAPASSRAPGQAHLAQCPHSVLALWDQELIRIQADHGEGLRGRGCLP